MQTRAIRFTYQGFNYRRACGQMRRRMLAPWMRYSTLFLLVAYFLGLWLMLRAPDLIGFRFPVWSVYLWAAVFLAALAGSAWRRLSFVWGSISAAPVRQGEMTLSLEPDGVLWEGEMFSCRYRWAAFVDAASVPQGLLLLHGPLEFLAIPEAAFASAAEKAELLAQVKGLIAAARG